MKRKIAQFTIAGGLLLVAVLAWSQTARETYAQQLVDETVAGHPDVLVLAMHVTPPGGGGNQIVASNIGRIGKKSDEDDMNVIRTDQPLTEPEKDTGRFEVLLPLKDKSGKTIGALGTVFKYGPDDKESQYLPRATQLRDALAKRIASVDQLFAAGGN